MTILDAVGVAHYKSTYKLDTFVETGCWKGLTLKAVRELGFKNIYSCDIVEEYVNICREKFPEIDIFHMKSTDMLEKLVKEGIGRTLFWLDAHFPEYYGGEANKDTRAPLLQELQIVLNKPGVGHDVIICDDIRNIVDPKNPVYAEELEDKFKITEYTLDDLAGPFRKTHYTEIAVNTAESLLILKPKLTA